MVLEPRGLIRREVIRPGLNRLEVTLGRPEITLGRAFSGDRKRVVPSVFRYGAGVVCLAGVDGAIGGTGV
jgi:hypothetical protein